jgi:hypothetical protein
MAMEHCNDTGLIQDHASHIASERIEPGIDHRHTQSPRTIGAQFRDATDQPVVRLPGVINWTDLEITIVKGLLHEIDTSSTLNALSGRAGSFSIQRRCY